MVDLDYLLDILKLFSKIDSNIKVENEKINLYFRDLVLCSISKDKIFLFENDLTDKITPSSDNKSKKIIDIKIVEKFLEEIGANFRGINHLGVSYSCLDIKREIQSIKEFLLKTSFKLYEEESGSQNVKWLFVGESKFPDEPIFEIVLTESNKDSISKWTPHIQIDFDTSLSYEDLEKIVIKFFGKDFIKWKFEVPDYGIPLIMSIIGDLYGLKICLGIGTNLRGSRKWHRQECIVEI